MPVLKNLPWWVILIILLNLSYNLSVIWSMLMDARRTSWRESGCTIASIAGALFTAFMSHAIVFSIAFVLPSVSRDKFRVGGERVRDEDFL